jgi:uncharacterized protein
LIKFDALKIISGEKIMSKIDALAKEFLSQKNIAVAGVKRNQKGIANAIFRKLKQTGHNVYALNPNADTIEDVKCYHDLKSIPEKIDGVVIVTKPSLTEKIVDDCISSGVKQVWMHNMMGKKGSEKLGSSISEKAALRCRENNITVIPGACPMMYCGLVDFGHKCIRVIARLTGGFRFD